MANVTEFWRAMAPSAVEHAFKLDILSLCRMGIVDRTYDRERPPCVVRTIDEWLVDRERERKSIRSRRRCCLWLAIFWVRHLCGTERLKMAVEARSNLYSSDTAHLNIHGCKQRTLSFSLAMQSISFLGKDKVLHLKGQGNNLQS